MDAAPFIRKRSVLALWIFFPLAFIVGTVMISKSVLEQARLDYTQSKALESVIPEMSAGLVAFEKFASDYRIETNAEMSLETRHIAALNAAAENADFTINAINFAQDLPEKNPPGTTRINIQIKGSGSGNGIIAFLNNIHARDRSIYEKRILTMPGQTGNGEFSLEAEFGKIYTSWKGASQ